MCPLPSSPLLLPQLLVSPAPLSLETITMALLKDFVLWPSENNCSWLWDVDSNPSFYLSLCQLHDRNVWTRPCKYRSLFTVTAFSKYTGLVTSSQVYTSHSPIRGRERQVNHIPETEYTCLAPNQFPNIHSWEKKIVIKAGGKIPLAKKSPVTSYHFQST